MYIIQSIKTKKWVKLSVGIIVIGIIFLAIYQTRPQDEVSKNPGLKTCPDELVIEEIAGPDRSGATVDTEDNENIDTQKNSEVSSEDASYYLVDGKQMAVEEFNTAWVAQNCKVPITNKK